MEHKSINRFGIFPRLLSKPIHEVNTMTANGPKDKRHAQEDEPIPGDIYPVIDTDLARDNLENDLPAADLEDL